MQHESSIVRVQFELDRLVYQQKLEPSQDFSGDAVARSVLDSLPAMGRNRRRLFWIGYLLGVLRVLRTNQTSPICKQQQEDQPCQAIEH